MKNMEAYFSGEDDVTSDYLIDGLLKFIINSAKIAVKDPENYEARSNLMWSSTLSMNPIMGLSKTQDWEVHMIEHQLGAYTDCAHGMGLAAISLPYYIYIYKFGLDKFVRFAKEVWRVDDTGKTKEEIALEGIGAMESFAKECGIVTSLKELGATEEMLPLIANSTFLLGGYKVLTKEEVLEILKTAYAAA
jgi:butanol dehydrogenase